MHEMRTIATIPGVCQSVSLSVCLSCDFAVEILLEVKTREHFIRPGGSDLPKERKVFYTSDVFVYIRSCFAPVQCPDSGGCDEVESRLALCVADDGHTLYNSSDCETSLSPRPLTSRLCTSTSTPCHLSPRWFATSWNPVRRYFECFIFAVGHKRF